MGVGLGVGGGLIVKTPFLVTSAGRRILTDYTMADQKLEANFGVGRGKGLGIAEGDVAVVVVGFGIVEGSVNV